MTVTEMEDYDPEGDQTENPTTSPNLTDGKESTSWSTELYKSAAFGNLERRSGPGLHPGRARPPSSRSSPPVEGWEGELQQDVSSGSDGQYRQARGKSTQIITLREPLSAGRIWFTKLTELTDGRYGVEISEIALLQVARLRAPRLGGSRRAGAAARWPSRPP